MSISPYALPPLPLLPLLVDPISRRTFNFTVNDSEKSAIGYFLTNGGAIINHGEAIMQK